MTTTTERRITVLDVLGADGALSRMMPNYEVRNTQIRLATAIAAAAATRRHMVGEAGTGTGKSFANLIDGAIAAMLDDERVLYSTAVKALQDQLANKDLPFLARVFAEQFGMTLRYAVLKGRSNYVCARNVARLEESDDFPSMEAARAFGRVVEWLEDQRDEDDVADIEQFPGSLPFDLRAEITTDSDDCTGRKCPFYAECFGEVAKRRAKNAHVVVASHALTFRDLMLREATDSNACVLPDYSRLILDECHHTESIARDQTGIEITINRSKRILKTIERLTTGHKAITTAVAKEAERERGRATQRHLPEDEISVTFRSDPTDVAAIKQADEIQMIAVAIVGMFERYLADVKKRMESSGEDGKSERQMRLGDETRVTDDDGRTPLDIVAALSRLSVLLNQTVPAWLDGQERERLAKVIRSIDNLNSDLFGVITPTADDSTVRYAMLDNDRVTLLSKMVDMAPWLRKNIFDGVVIKLQRRSKGDDEDGDDTFVEDRRPLPLVVVATSATVAVDGTTRQWRERVGCDSADELIVPAPFDYQKMARIFLPRDGRPFTPSYGQSEEDSESYVRMLSNTMLGLTLDAKGGAFLLFTSRRMLDIVHARISDELAGAGLLVLKQGDGIQPAEMIRQFKADGNAVLFGLARFWEGVDVQGQALRLVAMDKLPFNPPGDVLWSALCEHINKKRGDKWAWWSELAIPAMIIKMNQGFGRLIRTMDDYGTVAILDGRMAPENGKSYRTRILRSLPKAPVITSPEQVVAFYATMSNGR